MSKFKYVTAAKAVTEPKEGETNRSLFEFELDGRDFVAYPPSGADLALLFAAMDDIDPDDPDSIEGFHIGSLFKFFFARLDASDARFLKRRLRNRRDDFDLSSIEGIFMDMVEVWSGNPTESQPDSTPSPEPSGSISGLDTPRSV